MGIVQTYPVSKWEQDPKYISILEEKELIVDKKGMPKFYLDGSPYKINGRHQCIGKNHHTGYRCGRYAITGTTVCQVHGGGSPLQGRPGAVRKTSIFKYTRDLPEELVTRYEEALTDDKLLSVANEIALLESRIGIILTKLPKADEFAISLDGLITAAVKIKQARESADPDAIVRILPELISNIDTIYADRSYWDELTSLFQQRAKLISAEIEHRKVMRYYITAEEAKAIIEGIVHIINKNVQDITTKKIIAEEIERMFYNRRLTV